MKKSVLLMSVGLSLLVMACGGVSKDEYNKVVAEASQAQETVSALQAEADTAKKELEDLSKTYEEASKAFDDISKEYEDISKEYNDMSKEYTEYKESMAEYEGLAVAEAESRKLEAEAVIAAQKKAEEESKAAEQKKKEAEEKAGYDTGITYDQLARTPDDYLLKKIKFRGRVLQVIEGSEDVNHIRLATKGNYDNVILCEYKKSIVKSRILEDDKITVYGYSSGLYSYQSTGSGTITIPSMVVEKVDQ